MFAVDILLKEQNLTAKQVISRSGVSERTFFNFKNPEKRVSPNYLNKLARGFGVPAEQLELLKLFDRLSTLGGQHTNFHITLKNFNPALRKAVVDGHIFFKKQA